MSAVCSEDPGTGWGQYPLIGMAPELRRGTAASMPGGIPVREALSVRSDLWRSQEDFIREGMLWGVGERGIAGVILTGTSWNDHKNLHKSLKGRA